MNREMMRDSGVEWIGFVPTEWKKYRIKDVSDLSPTYSGEKPDSETLCTVIPMECVSEKGDVDTSNLALYENIQNGLTLFEKGDVIFAKITPCMENGKGAYIENLPTKYAYGSTEFHVLRTGFKVTGKFLYYYTFYDGFRNYAAANMTGAAGQKRVSTNFLKYTNIYLPDVLEQQAIARYLDQRCGKLDAIIAIKQQQIKTLDALRQSIIYQAVTKGLDASAPLVDSGVEWLGQVPVAWRVTRAKLVANIFIPQRNKPELNDDFGIPWVTMENMNGSVISKTESFVTLEAQKESGSRVLPKLSVIASCVGTFGVASINEIDVIINQQLQAYIPLRIDAHYLRYLITISNQYFDQVSSQTTIVYVNGEKFGNLPVLLPSRREQSEIVGFLSKETQRLGQLKTNLNQQISTLEAYKKSLIYECVTGKKRITPDHASDEIALA